MQLEGNQHPGPEASFPPMEFYKESPIGFQSESVVPKP